MASLPRVVRTIFEYAGSVVTLTASASMLNPRPEKRPTTRASSPKRFSTRTERTCLPFMPDPSVRADPCPARVPSRSRSAPHPRDHRIDVLLFRHDDVHHDGPGRVEAFFEHAF